MSKQSSLVKNTLIIAFGKLSTQFLTFLLLPLYTTYLATSEFGTVDLVMTYVTLLAPIITVSLEMGTFRFLIDVRGDEERQKRIISTVVRFTACMLALATAVYLLVWSFVNIPYGLYALGATVAVIVSNMFLQIARGFGDNVKFAIGGMIAGATTIAANILFIVVMGIGARGMLTSTILANVACAIYLFVALKLYRYIDFSIHNRKLLQQLLGYSAPLVPNGASWWAINAADRTIVAVFLGVAANGIYAAAYRFPLVFNGLFSFFSMSWTESASVHINSLDRDTFFSRTMNASVKLFGSLGLVMLAGLPIVFNLFVGLYSALYIAKKMTKQVMNTSVIAAAVSVVVSLVGIRFVGLYAPAAAMAVAFFAMAVYRHYDMKKYITIQYEAKTFVVLALLYASAITLYYMNTLAGNIANVVIIGAAALALNRSIATVLWRGVLSKGRVLARTWRR